MSSAGRYVTYGEMERDNGGGGIGEWYDQPADQYLDIVRAIIASKSATLRYEGKQYYRDHTITAAEKAALQRVLDARDVLERTP